MNHSANDRIGCPESRRLMAMERRTFLKLGMLGLSGRIDVKNLLP